MESNSNITIIGGGLAGLIAGIHLSKSGQKVLIIEKNDFPKHKVCGEYISNEVLNYLSALDLDMEKRGANNISEFLFSDTQGRTIQTQLPCGGFGISRFRLDEYLYQKAVENGCVILKDTVETCTFQNDFFQITTANNQFFNSKIVIGAFGKRSNLDLKMNRDFIQKQSPWLAVKAHYSGKYANTMVGLYHFEGGYCGVSKVEHDVINICYLTNYNAFKKYKNVLEFQKNVVFKNPRLKEIFDSSTMLFEKPLTISQVSFENKSRVENHILMIGDAGGLIHPLCGNGMAMAIHSAKMVSELTIDYLNTIIKTRAEFELKYQNNWNHVFERRIRAGRLLSKILKQPYFTTFLMRILVRFPSLLTFIVKNTHGKPI